MNDGCEGGAAGRALRGRPGMTADGVAIPLLANIGRPDDATRALEAGAEGVGLFRTEFLFIGRSDAPSEDEQVTAYAAALRAFGPGRPVVIRLADIGGDKAIPYLHLAAEGNPFLGVRGLRLCYEDRALIRTQVRAIARAGAAAGAVPHLMAPMVSTFEDVTMLREIVADALASLDAEGAPRAERLVVGIMVEVPSAALCAPELASEVDFFSIGSNDLTQYVLAMDRTNARLASVADALHPAVLRAIRATVDGADSRGIPVAVCGELAADPLGAAVLVGIGVDELSMDAGALDEVRLMLSRVTIGTLTELGAAALRARSAPEVRALAAAALGLAPAAAVARLTPGAGGAGLGRAARPNGGSPRRAEPEDSLRRRAVRDQVADEARSHGPEERCLLVRSRGHHHDSLDPAELVDRDRDRPPAPLVLDDRAVGTDQVPAHVADHAELQEPAPVQVVEPVHDRAVARDDHRAAADPEEHRVQGAQWLVVAATPLSRRRASLVSSSSSIPGAWR